MWLPSANVAVAMAVDRKMRTEAKDRSESLGIPQSPCPLVHPLESSVPTPTRAPAIISFVLELARVNSKLSKGTCRT